MVHIPTTQFIVMVIFLVMVCFSAGYNLGRSIRR